MKANHYHSFYNSLAKSFLTSGLSQPSDLEGASEAGIQAFEQQYQIRFPLAYRIGLLYFGKSMFVRGEFSMNINFELKALARVQQRAKEKNLKLFIKELQYITVYDSEGSWEDVRYSELIDLDKILFIYYSDDTDGYVFLDTSQENPALYTLLEPRWIQGNPNAELVVSAKKWTSFLRSLFFFSLEHAAQYYPIPLTSLPWGTTFLNAIHNPPSRFRFYFQEALEKEEQKGVLTIEEFVQFYWEKLEEYHKTSS
jgi:hypothetical protein